MNGDRHLYLVALDHLHSRLHLEGEELSLDHEVNAIDQLEKGLVGTNLFRVREYAMAVAVFQPGSRLAFAFAGLQAESFASTAYQ